MSSDTAKSDWAALAIAISALAAVGLFWAIVLLLVLLGQGPGLVKADSASALSTSGLKITDITGGLTALFALAVAAGSLWFTRRHNRLSVRPKISIVRLDQKRDGLGKGLYLRNDGLGPALIERISFELKDGPVLRSYENLVTFLFANSKYYFGHGEVGARWLEVLPKDTCESVLWLESEDAEVSNVFMHLLLDLRLVVNYKSFYEEPMIAIYDPLKPGNEKPLDPTSLLID